MRNYLQLVFFITSIKAGMKLNDSED